MSRKKKIVLPTEEEVAEYTGDSAPPAPGMNDQESSGAAEQDSAGERRPEAEDFKAKFLRAKADLANYQRRAERDRAEGLRYANARLVTALLPILDDLERVVTSSPEQNSDVAAVIDGAKLTLDSFVKVLSDFNVSRIEAEGKPFDPSVHEAMMQQPSAEHSEPTVLQEVAKGYRLGERVLRPARVIVSKPVEDEDGNADA